MEEVRFKMQEEEGVDSYVIYKQFDGSKESYGCNIVEIGEIVLIIGLFYF